MLGDTMQDKFRRNLDCRREDHQRGIDIEAVLKLLMSIRHDLECPIGGLVHEDASDVAQSW